jgi:hypothetical protein
MKLTIKQHRALALAIKTFRAAARSVILIDDQTIYLDRDEAIELLEAIQSKLGEMAVLITPEKDELLNHEVLHLRKTARKTIEAKDELLKQVMDWHSDPGSVHYNQCDTDPCHWCTMAQATFDAATKGEQP